MKNKINRDLSLSNIIQDNLVLRPPSVPPCKRREEDLVIKSALSFLSREQEASGGFFGFTLLDDHKLDKGYMTPFHAALISLCLENFKKDETAQVIRKKINDFLLTQKSEHWTFNYWARESEEYKTTPYPDDLDDTACALAAIYNYDQNLIDGEAIAKFVMVLTATEEKEGGPYRTWLVGPEAAPVWRDVDLAVNSNVGYFLSLQEVDLESVNALVEEAIEKENYTSPYYLPIYSSVYFISRFYQGEKREKMINFLLAQKDKEDKWNNPLDTAMAISALINLGYKGDLKKSAGYLLSANQNGFWAAQDFYFDKEIDGKKYYSGSAALTTAFALEAISKFNKLNNKSKKTSSNSQQDESAEKLYQAVIKKAEDRFAPLAEDFKKILLELLEKIKTRDEDQQIALMPYFFYQSLKPEDQEKIKENLLIDLCLANLYGWIAYTIYDDFLDEEGEPKLLGAANLLLRELVLILGSSVDSPLPAIVSLVNETTSPSPNPSSPRHRFARHPSPSPERGKDWQNFFQTTMDQLDGANTWEAINCRFKIKEGKTNITKAIIPDYKNLKKLAERSMGHALGPIAILFSLEPVESKKDLENIIIFFENYIIARQLNDDAHDWEEDFKRGQFNSASALILKSWFDKKDLQEKEIVINLEKDISEMQGIFWHEVIINMCEEILKRVEIARQALKKINVIADYKILEKLLDVPATSARQALKEREETIKFLKTYAG